MTFGGHRLKHRCNVRAAKQSGTSSRRGLAFWRRRVETALRAVNGVCLSPHLSPWQLTSAAAAVRHHIAEWHHSVQTRGSSGATVWYFPLTDKYAVSSLIQKSPVFNSIQVHFKQSGP